MWTIIFSVCVALTSIMTLMLCLCWRKKTPKNDMLGLHGMVTQKNPDENVNHLPSAAPFVVDGVNVTANAADSSNDANKRTVPTTNTRRSLPDIPSEQGTAIHWDPSGDSSSEHYATLGQYQLAKRHTLPNGVEARPSISQHSSISQADDAFSPYEKVKYDKIKSNKEHPYAQLQPSTSRQPVLEEIPSTSDERTTLLRVDEAGPSGEPSAPPRSRRSSAHSGGLDIPAASAVAGGIAASPELPYMTPPITQPNFSGDSQDSSKGYTSITVREPLANIKAQTKEYKNRDLDSHYSSVSDDSDDVYTTIPDPNNQIYTSESETYARIPALPLTVEVEVNPTPSRCLDDHSDTDDDDDELYEAAPQPPLPTVDSLKQVTGGGGGQSHSRQASSSSSIANVGSPKPEKRQANSPLPPPPPMAANFDDKVQTPRNLDDLYAKVHKNKKNPDELDGKSPDGKKSNRKSSSSSNEEKIKILEPEIVPKRREHNYEVLRKKETTNDPGYEKINNEEPGYASINGPDSITSSDPGYEVLKQRAPSEVDPNYEQLRHRISNASDCAGYSKIKDEMDGYSVVNKGKSNDRASNESPLSQTQSSDEPNYESMPNSESYSDNYAALKSTDSESDPNYETLRNSKDPPYEKVRDGSDYGYEKVRGRGYEDIDTSESSNGDHRTLRVEEPPYEQLVSDNEGDVPGYEKIRRKDESNANNNNNYNNNSVLEEGDDGVFQV